jgi:hypothetical protein
MKNRRLRDAEYRHTNSHGRFVAPPPPNVISQVTPMNLGTVKSTNEIGSGIGSNPKLF